MLVWLHFINGLMNGLLDAGTALLRGIIDELEHSDDEDDNIAIVDDNHGNGDEVQAEDAAAEPPADTEVSQPVEGENSLPEVPGREV